MGSSVQLLDNVAQLRKDRDDSNEAVAWGSRAFELAERLDDTGTLVHALNTIGTTEMLAGNPESGNAYNAGARRRADSRSAP